MISASKRGNFCHPCLLAFYSSLNSEVLIRCRLFLNLLLLKIPFLFYLKKKIVYAFQVVHDKCLSFCVLRVVGNNKIGTRIIVIKIDG
jgi:hypothetical protein